MGLGVFALALCQGKPKLRSIGGETGAADACGLRSGWGNLVISFLLLLFFITTSGPRGIYWVGLRVDGWDPIWWLGVDRVVCSWYGLGLSREGRPVNEPDQTQPIYEMAWAMN